MEWIKNLKVNQKLNVLIAMGAFFLVLVGLVGFGFLHKASKAMSTMYNDKLLPISYFGDIRDDIVRIDNGLLKLITSDNASIKSKIYASFTEWNGEINDKFGKYEAIKLDPYEVETVSKYKKYLEQFNTLQQVTISLAKQGKNAQAMAYYKRNSAVTESLADTAMALADYNVTEAEKIDKQNDKDTVLANFILIFTIVSALILLISMGMMISNMISKPIKDAISGLSTGSDEVSSAASQVASASQALAEGASEQAAAVQETSSTLEETSSMVHQNRENTQQAAVLARQAKQYAEKSNDEMVKMSTSMSELKNSSNEIAKIIKVIDEIAFQTNILSLNAAVEAARAGDAGKGFAVVAEEVRNLAQRSAQAAKDTTVIIESNIDLSENSVNIAKAVKESVESIGEQATKVSDLLEEISVATNEQAQGVEQINKAVSQMEMALQSNAATADESAAASRSLQEQAINVRDIVDSLIVLVDGTDTLKSSKKLIAPKIAKKQVAAKPPMKKIAPKAPAPAPSPAQATPESIIPLDDF